MPLAYLNGRFLRQAEAQLPLNDAGFVLGATVTDLCRTFRFRLFRWADHLRRFRQSCEAAQIPQPMSDDELTRIAEHLIERNHDPGDADLAVVVFATPGVIGYYLGEPGGVGDAPPTLGMHTFPLPFRRYRQLFQVGASLAVPRTRHVPGVCVDRRIKQRSRMHWWLAEREVSPRTALLLDENGNVTETAAGNFLVVKDGVVMSPPADAILGGVSLQVTRELCGRLGIGFDERPLSVADCYAADETLLTSTPFGLAPGRQIDDHTFVCPGPVAVRLLAAWNEIAGLDIARQILVNP